ncbi:hypothetical protein ACWKSP_20910 [Micromonosporaceae bacterium Da 78-11]
MQTTNPSVEFGCCYVSWGFYAADGSQFGVTSTGTHQMYLDPADVHTGSLTFSAG